MKLDSLPLEWQDGCQGWGRQETRWGCWNRLVQSGGDAVGGLRSAVDRLIMMKWDVHCELPFFAWNSDEGRPKVSVFCGKYFFLDTSAALRNYGAWDSVCLGGPSDVENDRDYGDRLRCEIFKLLLVSPSVWHIRCTLALPRQMLQPLWHDWVVTIGVGYVRAH